uniref:Uncharacterized protein n=1 Tax=Chenopodium quinoa TaxID=63459 RepID=A0A803N1L2_CHEQI
MQEKAAVKSAAYKNRMSWTYNRRVNYRTLITGDLVLRRTVAKGKGNEDGKLTANWEGPYRIRDKVMQGSFYLETMDGKPLKNLLNTAVLKKYYV